MIRVAAHTAVVLITLAGLALLWPLREALWVFVLSLGAAAAVRPIMERLQRFHLPRPIALLAAYALAVGVVVGPVIAASAPAFNELQRLGDDSIAAYDHWHQATGRDLPWRQVVLSRLPSNRGKPAAAIIQDNTATATPLASRDVTTEAVSVARALFGVTFSLIEVGMTIVIVLVLSIYWALDREHFERLWLSLLPAREREAAREVWRRLEIEVGGYCRSELLQAVAGAVLLALGYHVLGYPYPILMAMLGGLCWLLPWVGAVAAVLTVFVLTLPMWLFAGTGAALSLAVPSAGYTFLVLLLMELFVEPRLSDRRRYNTLLIAAVTFALVEGLGVAGLLLGPPLAVALQILGTFGLKRLTAQPVGDDNVDAWQLYERTLAARQQIADLPNPPQELVGLIDRLSALLDEARPWILTMHETQHASLGSMATSSRHIHVAFPRASASDAAK